MGYTEDGDGDPIEPLSPRFNIFTVYGGSGSISHRPFVGLGCRGNGLPGTPGGNFPHVFSLNTKGHAFAACGMDAYTRGYALDSGNITLTMPKAHAKFSHAMPLYIGPLRARGHTSLYTKGARLIGGGGTGGDEPGVATGPHTMSLVMTFRATGNLDMYQQES